MFWVFFSCHFIVFDLAFPKKEAFNLHCQINVGNAYFILRSFWSTQKFCKSGQICTITYELKNIQTTGYIQTTDMLQNYRLDSGI